MDIITYALSKKIAAHALSGVQSMSVNGQTLTINTKDSGVLTMTFPTPKDGISVTDIDVNANNQIVFTMSDGSEIISGKIPTVKGDKGDPGFSPIITENADNTDKIYKLDIETVDGKFTTPNLKGADGTGGSGGENTIESISVNGTPISIDENKNVDITVPTVTNDLTDELKSSYDDAVAAKHTHDNKTVLDGITAEKVESWDKAEENIQSDWNETDDAADGFIKNKPTIPSLDGYAKTSEIPSKVSELENDSNYLSSVPEEYVTDAELESKGYLTEHQDISGKVDKVEGKSLISDAEIARLASIDNYDDTDIKAEIAKKADTTAIPSKVSELTNDSNYQTVEQVNSIVTTEIAKVVADAPEDLNTLKEMSDWIAGHEDDASAMNSAISDNKTAITALQTGKADKSEIPTTVAELTDSTDYAKTADVNASIKTLQTDKANTSDLTAHTEDSVIHVTAENKTLWNTVSNKVNKEDGKALLADTDKTNYDDAVTKAHTHENKEVLDGITSDKVTYWDNKSEFSGSYNDLNDKPTIDAELSNTSENAIQNKVVTKEINKLYSDISFNDFDTATDGISFTDAEDGNMLVTDCTNNLLNPTLETCEANGVTCTRNVDANGKPDGTYTLNGTASDWTSFYLYEIYFENGKKYKMTGCVGGSGDTYYLSYNKSPWNICVNENGTIIEGTGEKVQILIACKANSVLNNIVFKPMLTTDLNATYDDFVPYGGYEIKSCGKNLLNVKSISANDLDGYVSVTIENGSTFILNGKNEFNYIRDIYFDKSSGSVSLKKNKKYIFSVNGIVDKIRILFRKVGTYVTYVDLHTGETKYIITPDEDLLLYFNINFTGQIEVNNLRINVQIEEVSLDTTEPTAYEPYTDETITVTNTTESPAFGLKSHKGITNIISPGNVKCVYPTNESGKGVLDSLYNKDKMLTEQNKSLEVLGKLKNLLNPILETCEENGIKCTRNPDGTYTLNGTAISDAYFYFISNSNKEKYKNLKNVKACGRNDDQNCEMYIIDSNGTYYGIGNNGAIINQDIDSFFVKIFKGTTLSNEIIKPMLTTDINATYDDFVPYTGDGETLTHDVAEIKNDLGGLTFSASGTTLTITDGTNTWTLGANS